MTSGENTNLRLVEFTSLNVHNFIFTILIVYTVIIVECPNIYVHAQITESDSDCLEMKEIAFESHLFLIEKNETRGNTVCPSR